MAKIPGPEKGKHTNPGQQVTVRSLLQPDSMIKENMAAGKKTLGAINGSLPGKKLGAK